MDYQNHLQYLNLDNNPFPLVPDASNYYLPEHINTMILELKHVVDTRKGFAIVIGEVGLGKTTMSRVLMGMLEVDGSSVALVLNTIAQGEALLTEINKDFGLPEATTFSEKMSVLNMHLLACHSKNRNSVIVIDDAQNLSVDSLELVRQISNLETDSDKLVQILLVGQPELKEKLKLHELRQLKSRIAYQAEVRPYSLQETEHYIHFKLNAAGNKGGIQVPSDSVKMVQALSAGSPRLINLIMDRYLYALIAYGCKTLDRKQVESIAIDAGLTELKRNVLLQWKLWAIGLLVLVSGMLFLVWTGKISKAVVEMQAESKVNHEADLKDVGLAKGMVTKKDMRVVGEAGLGEISNVIKNAELVRFLEAYGMESYVSEFEDAIENGMQGKALDKVNALSEWKVVILPMVIKQVREEYTVYRLKVMKKNACMLLWMPTVFPKAFYFGYQSQAVRWLQSKLLFLGFYEGNLDGVVGTKTITALAYFQAQHHLPATAYPDFSTLFLLEYEYTLQARKHQ